MGKLYTGGEIWWKMAVSRLLPVAKTDQSPTLASHFTTAARPGILNSWTYWLFGL
jgi:hypothetical protein